MLSLQVCNTTTDRKHADTFLERCVTESVMNIVSGFFNSPFSDNSTSLQVAEPRVREHWLQALVYLLRPDALQSARRALGHSG